MCNKITDDGEVRNNPPIIVGINRTIAPSVVNIPPINAIHQTEDPPLLVAHMTSGTKGI